MRSEFEKLLKQHKDAMTDELVKLGKHRQVQLAEWDIEKNESDYAFYFDSAWNAQQSKIDELQKENSALVHVVKSRDIQLENEKHEYDELMNKLVDSGLQNKELQKRLDAVKQLIEEYRDPPTEDKTFQHALSIVACELEQALKCGSDESN